MSNLPTLSRTTLGLALEPQLQIIISSLPLGQVVALVPGSSESAQQVVLYKRQV